MKTKARHAREGKTRAPTRRSPTGKAVVLLSGGLVGGEAIAGRPAVVDATLGKGHVILFGMRPFWRFQTQGSFFLAINAMLNWNDLGAGR